MIKKPQLNQTWVVCPHCGAKVVLHDNTAECHGVFIKCTRNPNCRNVFELIIENGKQILETNK